MYITKSPFWLKWLYPELTWHKNRTENSIYLTFDDGPIPVVTSFVLKTLNKFDAKATFFCIGDNVDKHPEIYQQLLNEGHQTGNHTYNHLRGWDTDDTAYLENVKKCSSMVRSDLFRPPYGRIKKSQIAGLKAKNPNLDIVMWDVLSGDFDTGISPEKCLQNVVSNTLNGSIIVFHDSLKAFPRLKYALPKALEYLKGKGHEFKVL